MWQLKCFTMFKKFYEPMYFYDVEIVILLDYIKVLLCSN